MSSIRNALVVGGGIAGLTLATSLARQGVTVDVLELHDRPAGAAITIQNRAVDGLQEIGVLEEFLAEGRIRSTHDFFAYFDADGAPLPTPSLPPRPESGLPQAVVIHRVPLARILREAAEKAGATVEVGQTITALEQSDDSVQVTLTNGEQRSYDLVIGADGVRSVTRTLVFGEEVVPRYTGTTMFRWIIPDVPEVGPVGFYQAEQLIVVIRLKDDSIYLATGRHYPAKPGRLTQEQAQQIVRENLACFNAPLMNALTERLTADSEIVVNDYDWLLTPNPWYRGRVVVIGDAAHATTASLASGGGMAIEDAVVLGQELGADTGVDEALHRFAERRYQRAKLVVDTSVKLDLMLQRGVPVPEQNALRAHAMNVLASPY